MSIQPKNSQHSAKDWIFGMAIGGVAYVLTMAFMSIISRLSPSLHDFGVFVSAYAMLKVVSLFVGLGLEAIALTKGYRYFVKGELHLIRLLRIAHFLWVCAVAILMIFIAVVHHFWGRHLYFLPRDMEVLLLVGWSAAAVSISTLNVALISSAGHTIAATVLDRVLRGLLTLIVGVSLVYFFAPTNASWALGGVVISNVVLAILCNNILSRRLVQLQAAAESLGIKDKWKEWVGDGLLMQLAYLITLGVEPIFVVASRIQRHELGLVGIFGALFAASKIVFIPFVGLRYIINRRFDELVFQKSAHLVWRELYRIGLSVGILSVGFALGCMSVGDKLLGLFGAAFVGYKFELAAMVMAAGCLEASKTLALVPNRCKRTKTMVLQAIITLPIGLAFTIAASARDSLPGMTAGFFIFASLQLVLVAFLVRQITRTWGSSNTEPV